MIAQLLPFLAPILTDVVKRVLPADPQKAAELEKEVQLALLTHADGLEKMRGEIILAEAKSESWFTSNWRPLLMMVMVCIIAMNYLLIPTAAIFYPPLNAVEYELPQELWTLLQIGVGGYIVGRSGEKMITQWTGKGS